MRCTSDTAPTRYEDDVVLTVRRYDAHVARLGEPVQDGGRPALDRELGSDLQVAAQQLGEQQHLERAVLRLLEQKAELA